MPKENQQARVTLKTLSERLGLSVATIDRALNKRGNVKKETYERIMQAVKELNYSPNKSASFLARGKVVKIAVIFQTYPSAFWDQVESGVNRAAAELADYGLRIEKIRTPNNGVEEQLEAIREVVESGAYDGIAISSDGSFEVAEWIDKAVARGIPTCTFNTDSPLSKRLFYVGADYRDAGKLAADLLCMLIGGKGRVALVLEKEDMYQFKEKVLGFREVLDRYGGVRMTGPLKISRDRLAGSIGALRAELAEADGIYLASGELGEFAETIANWGLKARLVGHDMTAKVHRYLQQGIIAATICQEPENQGYTAVKRLFDHLAGQCDDAPADVQSKLEIVMRENAKFYL